ncbi:flagellar operon protein [Lutispora thermophila DSM 19022]|uniref:Flagellar operon protein n=2 Tax=Lutispora TaxID=667112 RepID=A0A1M6G6Y7_9FIRM|nr:flagellar operon protein [Lutispora thermophila DSM 19022]
MDDFKININRNIIPVGSGNKVIAQDKPLVRQNVNFENILNDKIQQQGSIKFSKHAQERLISRNVKLTQKDIESIDKAVEKAAKKGVKDTLIILGGTALIANVKSKTIITAATEESLKDNIFTNIDGAIII